MTTLHRVSYLAHFFVYYFSESFGGTIAPCSILKAKEYICPTLGKFCFISGASQQPLIFKIIATCRYFSFFYPSDLIPSLNLDNWLHNYASILFPYSLRLCCTLDHFGYQHPDFDSWTHLTWYSKDRVLQWLQALQATLHPDAARVHVPCHQTEDHSILPLTRATML